MGVDLQDPRIADLCQRYGIAELSVFGSVARGDDTASSDVDLLYVLSPTSTMGWEIVHFRDQLEEILGRPVDLVPKSGVKRVIRERVLDEARVLYTENTRSDRRAIPPSRANRMPRTVLAAVRFERSATGRRVAREIQDCSAE